MSRLFAVVRTMDEGSACRARQSREARDLSCSRKLVGAYLSRCPGVSRARLGRCACMGNRPAASGSSRISQTRCFPGHKTRAWFSATDEPLIAWAGLCCNTPEFGPVFAEVCYNDREKLFQHFRDRPAVWNAKQSKKLDPDAVPEAPFFTPLVYKVSSCLSPSWREVDFAEIVASTIELQDYVRTVVADNNRRISDNFLSCYLKAVREEGTLSPIEEIMQLVLLILAGSDTTRTAMVMLTAILLQNPVVWTSLCYDQSDVAAAVEEGLRFEPPVGSFPRLALEEIDLDGHLLPKGSIHRCLGEALARVELQGGLRTLLRRAPNLTVTSDWPRMIGHGGIRRATVMTVKLGVDH
ncbi:Cytochrome P [Parasponia andersonii]|uniref:Cytochrome P n=1 Tax=Parasponia andersonii TaxID=3476 RepID=A0A2P5AE49_PARAD|nr:Cytochrome P [Parasponia andersonii]